MRRPQGQLPLALGCLQVLARLAVLLHQRAEQACEASFEPVADVLNIPHARLADLSTLGVAQGCHGDAVALDEAALGAVGDAESQKWHAPNMAADVGFDAGLGLLRSGPRPMPVKAGLKQLARQALAPDEGLKDAWRAVLDLLDETIATHPLPAEDAAAIIGTEGPASRFSHGLIEDPVTDFLRGRPAAAR